MRPSLIPLDAAAHDMRHPLPEKTTASYYHDDAARLSCVLSETARRPPRGASSNRRHLVHETIILEIQMPYLSESFRRAEKQAKFFYSRRHADIFDGDSQSPHPIFVL